MTARVPMKRVARMAYGDSLASDDRAGGSVRVYGSNGAVGRHDSANTEGPVIIVGRKGSFGKVNFSDEPVFAIDTTYFIDGSQTEAHLRWLYYVLSVAELGSVSQDTGVPGLSRESAYAVRLPWVEPHEQRRIAEFLDTQTARIDALIAAKRRLKQLLQEKLAASIVKAVANGSNRNVKFIRPAERWVDVVPSHWRVCSLKRVAKLQGGVAFPSAKFVDNGVRVVRINNLSSGQVDLTDAVSVVASDVPDDAWLNVGDLLVGMTGSLENWAVLGSEDVPSALNQRVGRFVPMTGNRLFYPYLKWIVRSLPVRTQIRLAATGTAQLNVSSEGVGSVRIALPPVEQQRRIDEALRQLAADVEVSSVLLDSQLDLLSEYRQALIIAAVTGQLDNATLNGSRHADDAAQTGVSA